MGRKLVLPALVAVALCSPVSAQASSPYTSAPYSVTTNSYAYGQAPVFLPDSHVLFGKDFKQGDGAQVYVTNEDGSGLKCLTCEMPPPNNVPAVRPQGDWVLFHSWNGHHITL